MASQDSSTPESVPDSPQQIVLSLDEWSEIEDSVIALHAAMDAGCASHDEAGELLVAVYRRLSAALRPVRGRYDPNYP
ncbi:MAG: hypothetical protein V3T83_12075 [Acidobacteriota bacterium]